MSSFFQDEKFIGKNELGTSFYTSGTTENSEKYARSLGLKNIRIFVLQTPDGDRTYAIANDKELLNTDQTLDGLGAKIDWMAVIQNFSKKKTV